MFVGLTNIITYTKMVLKFPLVFPGRQVEKRMFPFRKPTAYITLPCATALACDSTDLSSVLVVVWFLRVTPIVKLV